MKRIDEITEFLEGALLSAQEDGNRSMVVANTIVESILAALKQSSAIPWPDEAAWSKAPLGTFARAVDRSGACFFYLMQTDSASHSGVYKHCGHISDMSGIDWQKSLEYHPSLKSKSV